MFKEIFSKETGCAGFMNCDFTKIESNDGATKKKQQNIISILTLKKYAKLRQEIF